MKTTRFLLAAVLAMASAGAFATCKNGGTNWPTCTPPSPPSSPTPSTSSASSLSSSESTSFASSTASAQVSVAASPTSTSTASGGSVGAVSQSYEEFSRSNMYVLPAPVMAAPLPPGLCPQGDSMSIGILWNMFSYSRSSTRTEMECLDKVLASVRSAPVREVIQAPALPPASTSVAPNSSSASGVAADHTWPAKKPEAAKPVPKKSAAAPKAAPKASGVPSCEEAAIRACRPAKKT